LPQKKALLAEKLSKDTGFIQ